jgi:hypothetical protein
MVRLSERRKKQSGIRCCFTPLIFLVSQWCFELEKEKARFGLGAPEYRMGSVENGWVSRDF